MQKEENVLHNIFEQIGSTLPKAFKSHEVDVKHLGRNFLIHITDWENEVRIIICFHDDTMYDPVNISEVTDEKVSDGNITYTLGGIYLKEGFDPGYFDSGIVHDSIEELCFEMYEKVMDMKQEFIENEEREFEMYEEFKENMKFKKADMKDQFMVNITMNSDSPEDFELLSGAKNMTTLN